ncbi:MAG: ornithine cyclodeaminase family protein [Burkholderiales bacterium]|nr:ornithine cyclodeaminase family protein [Burkholderiales bacterium]
MHILDAAATARALPFGPLIAALRARFAAGCTVPPRHVHEIAGQQGGAMTSLLMPAWAFAGGGSGRYGVKIINVAPGNRTRGLPGLHGSYLLHDAVTGVPLALLDGDELTARRTAAASALAASWLARADADHLLVVGAGRVAALLPLAYREVRDLRRVTVWARRHEAAEALAEAWRGRGLPAQAAGTLDAAVAAADIVSCATLATEPVVQGRWLQPGSHLDLIGSFTPQMREADDDAFRGAAVWVDTDEALRKSGDLLGPLQRGVLRADAVHRIFLRSSAVYSHLSEMYKAIKQIQKRLGMDTDS